MYIIYFQTIKNNIEIYTGFLHEKSKIPTFSQVYSIKDNIKLIKLCKIYQNHNLNTILTVLFQRMEFLNNFTNTIVDVNDDIHNDSRKECKKISSFIISLYLKYVLIIIIY